MLMNDKKKLFQKTASQLGSSNSRLRLEPRKVNHSWNYSILPVIVELCNCATRWRCHWPSGTSCYSCHKRGHCSCSDASRHISRLVTVTKLLL